MGDLTRTEAGCMYYGWTIQGDKLFCREAYVDAAAVQAHLDNIVPSVGEMLDSGCASLDEINFMGPKAGWPTFKKSADSLGGVYWDVDSSFSKFKMPSFSRPLLLIDHMPLHAASYGAFNRDLC